MLLQLLKKAFYTAKAFIFCFVSLLFLSCLLSAQKLPFKNYTTADGLGHNRISKIFQDKKGFIWFATSEGLSRFDGYEFVTYGVREGLPSQEINDIREDHQGRLWIAANDNGIALFLDKNDAGKGEKFIKFTIDPNDHGANKVNRILFDSKDNLWCLTDNGVYRAPVSDNPNFTLLKTYSRPIMGGASRLLFEDAQGSIWFGIHNELFEARGDEIINHGMPENESYLISDGIQTKDGRILVLGEFTGLFEFVSETSVWRKLLGRTENFVSFSTLIEDRENSLWIGTAGGLLNLNDGKSTEYSAAQGLNSNRIISLFEDREGNLWGGSDSSGVFKQSDKSIVSYLVPPESLSLGVINNGQDIKAFFCKDLKKSIWQCDIAVKNLDNEKSVNDFSGVLPASRQFSIGKRGNFWGVEYGPWRASTISSAVFQLSDGNTVDFKEFFDKPFNESEDITVYFDEENTLWIGKMDGSILRVIFGKDGSKQIERFKWEFNFRPGFMLSDGHGGLWLFSRGRYGGRLRNGEYQSFQNIKSTPTQPASAFLDSRGWLWVGTRDDGVFVSKNIVDEQPVFFSYKSENGLLSNSIWSVTEDDNGQMYFGTNRGLSRFNPLTGNWNSYTTKDGLTGDLVNNLSKDLQGNIWINTREGLTKLNVGLEKKLNEPPPVYISHIKIAGEEYPISETGNAELPSISLDSSQNNLTIDFVGLQFKDENSLKYQYKLEGANADWSHADKNRSVTFANLDSGNYRFLVRAINAKGFISDQRAEFRFRIYPPIYLRWWFIGLCICLVSAIIYIFSRLRLQKMLEVERTRTLIATDLHDDIGSNLSKISVLSEVVRLQLEKEGKSDDKLLNSIAEISRSSVRSMSDIVWAINPQRDSVLEMIRKMREHAEEVCVPRNISVKFSAPAKGEKIKLPMDLRRDLYLTFKEAVNNIVKHSKGSKVTIDFAVRASEISLQIEDNGVGFEVSEAINGNGLTNMQKRIERLKGHLQIESKPNQGTKIIVRIPQN